MISIADAPLLALPGGSLIQFLLMTIPLLCVYLYFLYLAFDRPNIANPNDPRYAEDRIRLMDILYVYLGTLILFASLATYLLWFVRQRRKLSKKYEDEAIIILGNVEYNESYYPEKGNCCSNLLSFMVNGCTMRNNYGHVTYDLERVANHPACDYETRKRGKKALSGTIRKKVRIFYRYPREQVSILVLPKYPYSGQPKIDMEADWASFSQNVGLDDESSSERSSSDNHHNDANYENDGGGSTNAPRETKRGDRSTGVLVVSLAWMGFLLAASLFVVTRINVVENYYEDEDGRTAWIAFWVAVGGGIPLIAFLGNFIRWKIYERWILTSGTKKRSKSKKKKKRSQRRAEEEQEDDEEVGGYIQMT
mmetsp:Transcript_14285/g.30414  ORF Transcript_14285/g.30414 Transcript_14285/m.30414 type:complete len:365 (+) Transcript_14285:122-1216(+)